MCIREYFIGWRISLYLPIIRCALDSVCIWWNMDMYHLLLILIRTGINLLHLCSKNRSIVVYIWSFFWLVHKLLSVFVITNKSVPNWNLSESRSDSICLTTLYETISKNNYGGMNKRIKHLMIHSQQLFKHDFHIFIMIISYFYFEPFT